MKIKIIVFILISFFLVSCRGRDIGNLIFPISQAIEKNEDGEIVFSLQILNASSVTKVEVESGLSDTSGYVLSGKGPSLSLAIKDLEKAMKLDAGPEDLRSLVIHESILNQPQISFIDYLKYLLSNPFQRPSIFLYFTKENVKDIFSVSSIRQESIVYNLLNTPQATNIPMIVKPITYTDVLVSLIDRNRTVAIPMISIDKESASTEKDNSYEPRPTLKILEVCFNTHEINQFICLSSEDVVGLRWYQHAQRIPVSLGDLHNEVSVDAKVLSHQTTYENNRFTMTFNIEYHYISLYGDIDLKEYNEKVSQKIHEEIATTFLKAKEKNIDVYHLADYASRSFGQDILLENIDVQFNINARLNSRTFVA